MNQPNWPTGKLKALVLALTLIILRPAGPALAETPTPSPTGNMVITVQPGNTLISIALAHNLRLADLILANNLSASGIVFAGQQLVLPGVPAVPEATVTPGAAALDSNGPLPAPFAAVQLSEPVIAQGRTLVVKVRLAQAATLTGQFAAQPLVFNTDATGENWAITAIHALLTPGSYPAVITATQTGSNTVTYTQPVEVAEGPYGFEDVEFDDTHSALLDPDQLAAENARLVEVWSKISPQPHWAGPFAYPTANPRITSYYGTRRTYNNSAELSFHSGVDFGGAGTPIYAPAAGVVALAQPLAVRGNAVIIDHGLAVYSGYWHQSELVVQAGQTVNAGDLIGYVGGTGLVTGPHLHWELRLNGIAVDPLQWTTESIP